MRGGRNGEASEVEFPVLAATITSEKAFKHCFFLYGLLMLEKVSNVGKIKGANG